MNPICQVQDQLNTSEPTMPYIIGREWNLRKLPGRQWESNPQPSKQLQQMTIKTSASTETATTAYIFSIFMNAVSSYQVEAIGIYFVKKQYYIVALQRRRIDN